MSAGKLAAQVAHVTARLKAPVPLATIVLGGSTEQLRNLSTYMQDNNIPGAYYIDEGVNEVPPMSLTAVAFFTAGTSTPSFIENFGLYVDQTPYKLENANFRIEMLERDVKYYKQFRDVYSKIPEKIRNKYGGR